MKKTLQTKVMLFVFCIILIYGPTVVNGNKSVVVNTDYGDVEGYKTDSARIFYGIPYAQPPVNTLR